jgi:hypothetical protein
MDAHTVLVKARNRLTNPDRWSQMGNADQGGPGSHCAIGSVGLFSHAIYGHGPAEQEAFYGAIAALANVLGYARTASIARWNDAHERTHAEVLDAFDRAIAATAPKPDLSFLKDVRVEPERVA